MPTIETKFHLPPGPVTPAAQRKLIDIFFGTSPIFVPVKYGSIDGDTALDEVNPQKILTDFWEQRGRLVVTGKPASHFVVIMPNRQRESTWTGSISWCTPVKAVNKGWCDRHVAKVAQVMKLLGSPLAYAGLETDLEAKCWQWIDDPMGGQRKEPTLSAPQEGIPGMFWRLFIGAPFTAQMSILNTIQSSQVMDLDNGLWMVSPYTDPQDAETESGKNAETELINQIGSDFFFDHITKNPPTQVPTLGTNLGTVTF